VLPDAGLQHNRENGSAAKPLTWRRYLVAGARFVQGRTSMELRKFV
jgi:hypothetical protein